MGLEDRPQAAGGESALIRAIGVRRLTASIINVTIGAGIFVLPATVASGLGPAAPLAYLVCGTLMALIVLCFASAGSRVSLTGGLYAYIEVAFGPFVGFLGGVLYSLMASFAVASVASAFAGSVGVVWPPVAAGLGRAILLAVLFGGLVVINVRGVGPGMRLVELASAAKLIPLIVFAATGIWFVRNSEAAWPTMASLSLVGRSAITLIFAFVGAEIALVPSGEINEPGRTVPFALLLALVCTTTLYLLIQHAAQGLLGASLPAFGTAPLAEAAGRVLGRPGRLLMLGGATISMFGYISGDLLGSPRALFALARDGVFPATLARVHPRFRTPHIAIVTYGLLVGGLAISSSFSRLAILANVAALSLYLLAVAASHALQRRNVGDDRTTFTVPGGALVPGLAATVIVWLLSQATRREFGVEAAVLVGASLLYFVRRSSIRSATARLTVLQRCPRSR